MEAFIERYLEWLNELLGDPVESRRQTTKKRLRNLHAFHARDFERLLTAASDETLPNYNEADITLKTAVEFYPLPGNFRKFLCFERRTDGDPNKIVERKSTIPQWHRGPGIVLSTPERGFRVRPVPVLNNDEAWTLCYQKQPIELHYGFIDTQGTGGQDILPNVIVLQDNIPEIQGTLVKYPEYYKGELIHILEGEAGAGQSIEVSSFNPMTLKCNLKRSFDTVPFGKVKYEFRTILPPGLDRLFALSVAVGRAAEIPDADTRRLLISEWREMFSAAKKYMNDQTSDRPQRMNPRTVAHTVDVFAR